MIYVNIHYYHINYIHIEYYQYKFEVSKVDGKRKFINKSGFETKDEAYNVLKGLEELIDEYDQASIADFYNLCGITGKFTDHKWGWTDLTGSRVVRAYGGGYEVELPRPEALD